MRLFNTKCHNKKNGADVSYPGEQVGYFDHAHSAVDWLLWVFDRYSPNKSGTFKARVPSNFWIEVSSFLNNLGILWEGDSQSYVVTIHNNRTLIWQAIASLRRPQSPQMEPFMSLPIFEQWKIESAAQSESERRFICAFSMFRHMLVLTKQNGDSLPIACPSVVLVGNGQADEIQTILRRKGYASRWVHAADGYSFTLYPAVDIYRMNDARETIEQMKEQAFPGCVLSIPVDSDLVDIIALDVGGAAEHVDGISRVRVVVK